MLTYAKYAAVSRSAKALKFLFLYDFRGVDVNYLSSVAAGVAHFCALRHRRYKLKLEEINIAFLFFVNFVLPCLKIDPTRTRSS